jgi:hypothetical protein
MEITGLLDGLHHARPSSPTLDIIRKQRGNMTFAFARKLLISSARERQISMKNYFESVISLLHQKIGSSEDCLPELSNYDVDDNSFTPIRTKHKIVYYVDPLNREEAFSSVDAEEKMESEEGERYEKVKSSLFSTGKSAMS